MLRRDDDGSSTCLDPSPLAPSARAQSAFIMYGGQGGAGTSAIVQRAGPYKCILLVTETISTCGLDTRQMLRTPPGSSKFSEVTIDVVPTVRVLD